MVSGAKRDKELRNNLNYYVESANVKCGAKLAEAMKLFIDANYSDLKKLSDDEIIDVLKKQSRVEMSLLKETSGKRKKIGVAVGLVKDKLKHHLEEMKKKAKISAINQKEKNNLGELEKERAHEVIILREKVLRTLNYPQICQLGRKFHVPDMKTTYYKTGSGNTHEKKVRREYDDYVSDLVSSGDAIVEDFIEFAKNCGIHDVYKFKQDYEDVQTSFTKKFSKIKLNAENERRAVRGEPPIEPPKEPGVSKPEKRIFLEKIADKIRSYVPKTSSQLEVDYQLLLCGYLQNDYPEIELERQKGSSRPDLVIRDVGIEIKGPTFIGSLQTIADKLLRYPQHFGGGIIIVLFDVQVNNRFYGEWLEGIKMKYSEAIVIKR